MWKWLKMGHHRSLRKNSRDQKVQIWNCRRIRNVNIFSFCKSFAKSDASRSKCIISENDLRNLPDPPPLRAPLKSIQPYVLKLLAIAKFLKSKLVFKTNCLSIVPFPLNIRGLGMRVRGGLMIHFNAKTSKNILIWMLFGWW